MLRRNILLETYVVIAQICLVAPILAIVMGSLTTTQYVVFPPKGLTLKWYGTILDRPEMVNSLFISLFVAFVAATLAMVLGLLVSAALVRFTTRLNWLLWLLAVSSMMIPSVVLGFAFLQTYTYFGFGGTVAALVMGHLVLVAPFATVLIVTGMRLVDSTLEEAARSLGANWLKTFAYVTLPLMRWSVVAGWGLAFLVSFSDASVSIFLNSPQVTTLPVRIFDALRYSPLDPQLTAITSALAIATLVVLFAIASFLDIGKTLDRGTRN